MVMTAPFSEFGILGARGVLVAGAPGVGPEIDGCRPGGVAGITGCWMDRAMSATVCAGLGD